MHRPRQERLSATDVLDKFHEHFAMSHKGKEYLRAALMFVKESMQEVVRPLLADQSNIHRKSVDPKPRYSTCCEIGNEKLPWVAGKMDDEDGE